MIWSFKVSSNSLAKRDQGGGGGGGGVLRTQRFEFMFIDTIKESVQGPFVLRDIKQ